METIRAGERLLERDGVAVHVLGGETGTDDALALLDAAEAAAGVPLVDEGERARLADLAAGRPVRTAHWHPLLATSGGRPAGYAGVVVPDHGDPATADVATDRTVPSCGDATVALLDGLCEVAGRHGARRLIVWFRHATDADTRCAQRSGFDEHRRLLVLGRALDVAVEVPPLPADWRLRRYRPGGDDDAVVAVLAAAFAGTPDAGWDLDRLAERRSYDWFDPADVLVAEDPDGRVAAVHWTKRRGGASGEVYVLAVGPSAQGRGLGRALLLAGLDHLARRGCEDVVLWVDAANRQALRLYEAEGFEQRWTDVAFTASP